MSVEDREKMAVSQSYSSIYNRVIAKQLLAAAVTHTVKLVDRSSAITAAAG